MTFWRPKDSNVAVSVIRIGFSRFSQTLANNWLIALTFPLTLANVASTPPLEDPHATVLHKIRVNKVVSRRDIYKLINTNNIHRLIVYISLTLNPSAKVKSAMRQQTSLRYIHDFINILWNFFPSFFTSTAPDTFTHH